MHTQPHPRHHTRRPTTPTQLRAVPEPVEEVHAALATRPRPARERRKRNSAALHAASSQRAIPGRPPAGRPGPPIRAPGATPDPRTHVRHRVAHGGNRFGPATVQPRHEHPSGIDVATARDHRPALGQGTNPHEALPRLRAPRRPATSPNPRPRNRIRARTPATEPPHFDSSAPRSTASPMTNSPVTSKPICLVMAALVGLVVTANTSTSLPSI